jgi:TolB protein
MWKRLSHPPAGFVDRNPDVSPDGRRIVFEREGVDCRPDCSYDEIFKVDADGTHLTQLTHLWIVNLRTGREHRVTLFPLRGGDTPDWSPDGKRILFHSNLDPAPTVSANLYTIRPDGTHLRQLTFAKGGALHYLGSSYSPDGRRVTVGRRPATGGTAADVYVMRANGTHIHKVTRTLLYDSYPD